MTGIQVHPDTESMEFHMQVLKDNWDESFSEYGELLEVISIASGRPAVWWRTSSCRSSPGALGLPPMGSPRPDRAVEAGGPRTVP